MCALYTCFSLILQTDIVITCYKSIHALIVPFSALCYKTPKGFVCQLQRMKLFFLIIGLRFMFAWMYHDYVNWMCPGIFFFQSPHYSFMLRLYLCYVLYYKLRDATIKHYAESTLQKYAWCIQRTCKACCVHSSITVPAFYLLQPDRMHHVFIDNLWLINHWVIQLLASNMNHC